MLASIFYRCWPYIGGVQGKARGNISLWGRVREGETEVALTRHMTPEGSADLFVLIRYLLIYTYVESLRDLE